MFANFGICTFIIRICQKLQIANYKIRWNIIFHLKAILQASNYARLTDSQGLSVELLSELKMIFSCFCCLSETKLKNVRKKAVLIKALFIGRSWSPDGHLHISNF